MSTTGLYTLTCDSPVDGAVWSLWNFQSVGGSTWLGEDYENL